MALKIFVLLAAALFSIGLYARMMSQESSLKTYIDVEVDEFKKLMVDENTIILDVRTRLETKSGIIEGAHTINYLSPNFKKQVSALSKDKTYLVYCRSGHRSVKACKQMSKLGFSNLYNLKGGYLAWQRQNR